MKLSIPLIYLSLLLLASCQEHNSQNKSLETSVGNNEIQQDNTFCAEHNRDCGKFAMEMNMSLDEYHKWEKTQEAEISQEDAMTDANGDIVDPNASSNERSSGKIQKQWVNCSKCNGKGREICHSCNGTGQGECISCNGTGTAHAPSGAYTCNQCNGRGIARCSSCYGHPDGGNCQSCDGRGQVLVAY